MAAVYLHNAVHSRNASVPSDILEHSRNLSTISSTTLFTNTTLHSHPTSPLLHTLPPGAAAASYFDQLSRQPRRSDDTPPHLRWDDRLPPIAESKVVGEKTLWGGNIAKSPFRGQERIKVVWECVISAWAAFNTIRYFMGFAVYDKDSSAGQSLCLALGTCTGISVALFLCSQILAAVTRNVRTQTQALQYLPHIRLWLHFLSSLFVLGPALISFILTFVWRHSSNARYNIDSRCHIDIDIVWSATRNTCTDQSSPWGVWVALSSLRLVLTFIILAAYHIFALIYPNVSRRPLHHRLRSNSYVSSPLTPGGGPSSTAMMLPRSVNHDLRTQHQISDSTLVESFRPASRLGHARSYSSNHSGEGSSGEMLPSLAHTILAESEGDREDRHQSLLAQITQETDEALEYALGPGNRETGASSPPSPPALLLSYSRNDHDPTYDSDDDDDEEYDEEFHGYGHGNHDNLFNLPIIPPVLGYNEFGLPYPPDQPVRMLNGYIRRMPTIESMGSGEAGTSIAASSAPAREGSLYTSSRPPTRNTLLSFVSTDYDVSGSRPPSRPNSLSARAELMAGMSNTNTNAHALTSEHGELLGGSLTKRISASPTSYEGPSFALGGDASSSAGSRATTLSSYHTATTGSSGDHPFPSLAKDTQERLHEV